MALRQSDSAWAPCEHMWQDEGGEARDREGAKVFVGIITLHVW